MLARRKKLQFGGVYLAGLSTQGFVADVTGSNLGVFIWQVRQHRCSMQLKDSWKEDYDASVKG